MKEAKYKIDPNCWTMDFYSIAYENLVNEKIPVVIPSYSRWNKASFLDDIRNYRKESWPIYVVVRESQKDLYEKNYGDISEVTILAFEDEQINDIGKTRQKILDYFGDYKSIFMLDDDIRIILKSRALYVDEEGIEHDKCMPHKISSDYSDPARLLAMWQLIHEHLTNKYEDELWCTFLRCLIWTIGSDCVGDRSYTLGGPAGGAQCVNLDILKKKNLNYVSNSFEFHEDMGLMIRAMKCALYVASINFINDVIDYGDSVIGKEIGLDNKVDRFKYQDSNTIAEHDDFRYVRLNNKQKAAINWDKYLKALGIYDRYGSIEHELYDKLVNYI